MDKLKITDFLKLCVNFQEDPTEENEGAIQEFISQLVIKDYLSFKDKLIAAMAICSSLRDDTDALECASVIEMGKITNGLLRYCVNLENDLGPMAKLFAPFDAFYEHGLIAAIIKVAERDYKMFCDMVNNTLSFTNMWRLLQTAQMLNDTEYDKWIEAINDLKTTLTPELVKNLSTIGIVSSGAFEDLERTLSEQALSAANAELRANDIRYQMMVHDVGVGANDEENAE